MKAQSSLALFISASANPPDAAATYLRNDFIFPEGKPLPVFIKMITNNLALYYTST